MKDFNVSSFKIFDTQWALVSAGDIKDYNTMTVSWGGLGTLWNKPVATIYVKPLRYTYKYLEANDYFTISFYDEKYRPDLAVLGSKSGRDCDKTALTSLTPAPMGESVTFTQAQATLLCKTIYRQDLVTENMPSYAIENYYKTEAPHRMYIGEVIDIRK